MHYLSSPGYKNLEIEIYKRCFANHVPHCFGEHYTLAGVWHIDSQHFDHRHQYRCIILFTRYVIPYFQKQAEITYNIF